MQFKNVLYFTFFGGFFMTAFCIFYTSIRRSGTAEAKYTYFFLIINSNFLKLYVLPAVVAEYRAIQIYQHLNIIMLLEKHILPNL